MKRLLLAVLVCASSISAQDFGHKVDRELAGSQRLRSNQGQDVLVIYESTDSEESRAVRERDLRSLGAMNIRHHAHAGISAMRVSSAALARLERDEHVRYIAPDRDVTATDSAVYDLDEVRTAVRLSGSSQGAYTGDGIGVALIDSGIADTKAFHGGLLCLANRVVYSQNFASDSGTTDTYGHGTHVASILGSNANCDNILLSNFNGIAPAVNMISLRVLNAGGQGKDSAIVAAIDRAIALKGTYNIRVINLSLGRPPAGSYVNDPLCQAAEKAWKAGIVVVVAAGNRGRDNVQGTLGYGTISAPGNDPYVITVGAARTPSGANAGSRADDTVASYSSKGPSAYDHIVKPDLLAPGNLVNGRTVLSSTLAKQYPANVTTQLLQLPFFRMSGTSMAAPVVAGAAALLLDQDSSLTPDQVKARLMKTAWKSMAKTASIYDAATRQTFSEQHDIFTVGAGYLDIGAALATTEKSAAGKVAISPRVVLQNGVATLSTTYANVAATGIVWGSGVTWGSGIVWGDTIAAATGIVWGDGVVWGTETSKGYGIIWGTGVNWGDSDQTALSVKLNGDK
jgi:serine protease AprX